MPSRYFFSLFFALILLRPTAAMDAVELAGVMATPPPQWIAVAPSTTMRLAQFQLPASAGVEPAQLIVFYFGPHQGGTAAANIARWQSQFSTADGGPVQPLVQSYQVHGMAVTQAEFQGRYARGIGTGPVGEAKSGQALLAAIVEGPSGKLFVQMFGATAAVANHRAGFDAFVRGMRPLAAKSPG